MSEGTAQPPFSRLCPRLLRKHSAWLIRHIPLTQKFHPQPLAPAKMADWVHAHYARVRSPYAAQDKPFASGFTNPYRNGGDIMLKINYMSTLFVGIDVSSKSNSVYAMDFEENKYLSTSFGNNQPSTRFSRSRSSRCGSRWRLTKKLLTAPPWRAIGRLPKRSMRSGSSTSGHFVQRCFFHGKEGYG